MNEEIIFKKTETKEPRQTHKFEITVKNKFDEDKRNIRVCHNQGGYEKCDTLYYSRGEDQQKYPHLHEKTYSLGPEDSLVIELGREYTDFNWDVHVELPFVADYNLYWELGGENDKKVQVERPIIGLFRDTTPKDCKKVDEARSVLVIPRDQGAWKLEIKSPRNLHEHYKPIHVLAESFEMSGGTPDSVTVGDNNEG